MKRRRPIYLDHQATTPCDPEVVQAMLPYFSEHFGNASSRLHAYGVEADAAVEAARETIARAIGAGSATEIVFTSGATEADNMALVGAVAASSRSRRHIVISALEHEAVMEPARWLTKEAGCELTIVKPGPDGRVDPEALDNAIRDDTLIVSVMHVNNVIGTINDIAAIGESCRRRGALLHTDAAQSLGKVPLDVGAMKVDMASVSGHKLYAPKGIGFLYNRRRPARSRIEPLVRGGGQERGLRAGTIPVPLIVGLAKAVEISCGSMSEEALRLTAQRDRLLEIIAEGVEGLRVNGPLSEGERIAGNLHVSFDDLDGEALLVALRSKVAASSGSACASGTSGPSRVLAAMGLSARQAAASLRLGLGRFTTDAEIEEAGTAIVEAVEKVRERS